MNTSGGAPDVELFESEGACFDVTCDDAGNEITRNYEKHINANVSSTYKVESEVIPYNGEDRQRTQAVDMSLIADQGYLPY